LEANIEPVDFLQNGTLRTKYLCHRIGENFCSQCNIS